MCQDEKALETNGAIAIGYQSFHLVNEGPERGEDLFEGSFRLRDLQKAQMDLENLFHQGVVTKIRSQLDLREKCHTVKCKWLCNGVIYYQLPFCYLESHDEDAQCVQNSQTDLCRHICLQQTLTAYVCFCMRVH